MSATSAVLQGRQAALALMLDACTIDRPLGEPVYDPATDTSSVPVSELYAGPCRVKPGESDRAVEVGADTVSLFPFVVSVPMSATDVGVDDLVTVTASVLDPSLVGTVLRVRQAAQGTFLTARRLGCEVAE